MLIQFSRRARVRAATALATACAILIGCQPAPQPGDGRPEPVAATNTPQTALLMAAAEPHGQFEEVQQPTPSPAATPTTIPTLAPSPAATSRPEPVLFETGVASTYGQGDGFEGKRTACGQIFRTGVVQVAHKTLPCGTRVRIEDVATGNAVDANVTDRGPYIPGRVVDLSWAAFSQLDPRGPGLLRVNVYLVQDE
jgi:rare lipoprotein A